jgi:hypothetical protein
VTFKDLKKRVALETSQQQTRFFERLQNKPFWIWDRHYHKQEDIRTNRYCCFNHIIFDSIVAQTSNKHLWIKKATGLGVSEFMLRFMAWLCLKDGGRIDVY